MLIKTKIKRKIYLFKRLKTEKSVVTMHYQKLLNRLFKTGLKSRYLKFFYMILREHKKKVKKLCKWKYGSSDFTLVPIKVQIPTFPLVINRVFEMISLKLELRYRKFRKKEIIVPMPIAPWRGLRMGLTYLLTNSKSRVQQIKVHRKVEFLHKLLTEIWDTYYGISLTAKAVIDFTDNVLANTENFRSTQFFPVKQERRNPVPKEKLIEETKTTTSDKRTDLNLNYDRLKRRYRSVLRNKYNYYYKVRHRRRIFMLRKLKIFRRKPSIEFWSRAWTKFKQKKKKYERNSPEWVRCKELVKLKFDNKNKRRRDRVCKALMLNDFVSKITTQRQRHVQSGRNSRTKDESSIT